MAVCCILDERYGNLVDRNGCYVRLVDLSSVLCQYVGFQPSVMGVPWISNRNYGRLVDFKKM